jgi:hypothetical protein
MFPVWGAIEGFLSGAGVREYPGLFFILGKGNVKIKHSKNTAEF